MWNGNRAAINTQGFRTDYGGGRALLHFFEILTAWKITLWRYVSNP
jgi:hypothetical protein